MYLESFDSSGSYDHAVQLACHKWIKHLQNAVHKCTSLQSTSKVHFLSKSLEIEEQLLDNFYLFKLPFQNSSETPQLIKYSMVIKDYYNIHVVKITHPSASFSAAPLTPGIYFKGINACCALLFNYTLTVENVNS